MNTICVTFGQVAVSYVAFFAVVAWRLYPHLNGVIA